MNTPIPVTGSAEVKVHNPVFHLGMLPRIASSGAISSIFRMIYEPSLCRKAGNPSNALFSHLGEFEADLHRPCTRCRLDLHNHLSSCSKRHRLGAQRALAKKAVVTAQSSARLLVMRTLLSRVRLLRFPEEVPQAMVTASPTLMHTRESNPGHKHGRLV